MQANTTSWLRSINYAGKKPGGRGAFILSDGGRHSDNMYMRPLTPRIILFIFNLKIKASGNGEVCHWLSVISRVSLSPSLGYPAIPSCATTLQFSGALGFCFLWGFFFGSGLPEETRNYKSRHFSPQVISWVLNRLVLPQNPKPYPFTTSNPYILTALILCNLAFRFFSLVRLLNYNHCFAHLCYNTRWLIFWLISVILLSLLLTALLLLYDTFLLLLVLQKEQWGVNPQLRKFKINKKKTNKRKKLGY